jgi:diguanylate cyclase
MHYTAMGGVTLYPFATTSSRAPALSTDLLAIVVAVVAFGISGVFLLLLLPEHQRVAPRATVDREAGLPQAVETLAASATLAGAIDDATFGTSAASARRFARHLPIERDGVTQFLAVEDVVAVHANAHYTYIFNGNDKLFCPLAISDVESRLDDSRFVRVHRSHIVNIDRVIGYKRSGDNELVQVAGVSHYAVPVSRSRIGSLRLRVAALTGIESALVARRRQRVAAQ